MPRRETLEDIVLPGGPCPRCEKLVPTHASFGDRGEERRHCLFCDTEIESGLAEFSGATWADMDLALIEEKKGCGGNCGVKRRKAEKTEAASTP